MQVEIGRNGRLTEEMMSTTSSEADVEGISGFMYGAAVSVLADAWVHGEALRKVHNKEYGVSDDRPGVVNTAIFTIGEPAE